MKTMNKIILALILVAMFFVAGCHKEPGNGGNNNGGGDTPDEPSIVVTFKANGGKGVMQPQSFEEGVAQHLTLNAFTRDYNTFLEWNTSAYGSGTSYTDGQEVTLSKSMTLYAQWNPITCTVTFDPNGGTGEMTPQTLCVGVQQTLKANKYAWEEHWFCGWNTSADGTGISYADCEKVTFMDNVVLYAQWRALKGVLNGHEWVDLGLPSGTLWATCNIGADSPTAFGDYFAWGETEPQAGNIYDWTTYKYANDDSKKLTKYCNKSNFGDDGFTDNLTRLLPEDDAATVNWGAGWRLPTTAEAFELREYCSYAWTNQDGVNGRLIVGPNGNSIFLPAAGSINNEVYNQTNGSCYCWTSTLYLDYPSQSWSLYFFPDSFGKNFFGRDNGFSVRPVCSPQ